MDSIDGARFQFDETASLVAAVMVGFLVFTVALDLRWEDLGRVVRAPKAPLVGMVAQFGVLPAVAFVVGALTTDVSSVALGLVLVACCPGGALSNYLTGLARGDVAISVVMTAISTAASVIVTPLVFLLWASMSPQTSALLRSVEIAPTRVAFGLVVMLALPVTLGIATRARFGARVTRIRRWARRLAIIVFAIVVLGVLGSNAGVLVEHGRESLLPVGLAFAVATIVAWSIARVVSLSPRERRAIALEVSMQNVALAIGMAMAFFGDYAGVVITAATWGAFQVIGGFAVASLARQVEVQAGE